MNYTLIYALFFLSNSLLCGLQADDRHYNDMCYLVAHNAFANKSAGWWYRQQNWGISTMLEKGVRGFMLDIHPLDNKIYLCHGGCSPWFAPQKGLWATFKSFIGIAPYDRLDVALEAIKTWLGNKNNKHEIITLFFENYVGEQKLNAALSSIFGRDIIFTPEDFINSGKKWPFALSLQGDNSVLNKRLICFNEAKGDASFESKNRVEGEKFFFPIYDYVIESSYGVVIDAPRKLDVCYQRNESAEKEDKDRYLFLFNYFSTPSTMRDAMHNNQMHIIGNALSQCQGVIAGKKRTIPKNMKPNFIALDFVDKGEGKKIVDLINQKASMNKVLHEIDLDEKRRAVAVKNKMSLFFRAYQRAKKLFQAQKKSTTAQL